MSLNYQKADLCFNLKTMLLQLASANGTLFTHKIGMWSFVMSGVSGCDSCANQCDHRAGDHARQVDIVLIYIVFNNCLN